MKILIIWTVVASAFYLILKIIEKKKMGKNKTATVSTLENILKEHEENDRGTNTNPTQYDNTK